MSNSISILLIYKVLARDGFQCKVTGAWNYESCMNNLEVHALAKQSGLGLGGVHVCHIVKENLLQIIDCSPDDKRQAASNFVSILESFGLASVVKECKENGIHSLSNLICLSSGVHEFFDNLNLWFEPTEVKNTYTVHTANGIEGPYKHWCSTVIFSVFPTMYGSNKELDLPLPDPQLLTLHEIMRRSWNYEN
ncbi:hypothetical protein CYLTODRAFT_65156 [Cylindrobasidium torrendii FP15055 ss-10]|uniref:HNH nuclease domain-containing protein n=1 Tax=Cylindrobasidium torrendii FP15055 ss-10 TaxID=1314674 RepID=A0A0D7B4M3_9AGAR|nr:hypothetical protein CYLTODRAFT_65156 [Cylindrobasidium torrendii FP15055 ss-10]